MKAFWFKIYDKVKVVIWTALTAAVLAVVDALSGFDWTANLGSWGAVIPVALAAFAAFWRKEFIGNNTPDAHTPGTPEELDAPPVNG